VVLATFPSAAPACCSQILQPFLARDLSQKVQMAEGLQAWATHQQLWDGCGGRLWGAEGTSLCGLLCWSGSEPGVSLGSHAGFCCV